MNITQFENPSPAYRSIPFWGWNDAMQEPEIIRQIHEMKQAGIGGFFIHSREGLETEYLSPQWFSLIKTAVKTATELDMQVWLYDEDRWPSGSGGGAVAKEYGDIARCKGLTIEVCSKIPQLNAQEESEILALFTAVTDNMDIFSLHRVECALDSLQLKPGEKLLILRMEVSGKSEWFNNEAPPDNLSTQAVEYFIQSTHEQYAAHVGGYFGQSVHGIFSDEPSLHDRHASFDPNRGWIPWTDSFLDYFIAQRGYNPLDLVPYIYFNGTHSQKIRHDYWRTVSEKYALSFSTTIKNWCAKNNIKFTGHYLQEDKLGLCTRVCGGSLMLHYAIQDMPGIDMLDENIDEYLTVKQCTSVANQFDKPQAISETYGCTGWAFSFEGQRWIGDWQYVLGINRLSKHLSLYSLKGCRKRDYPPSLHCNNSWWEKAPHIEDYFARLSLALTGGRALRDVLVLHPQSTAWTMLGCNPYGNPLRREERDVPHIDEYGYKLNRLLKFLSGQHYDYDLGDELLIKDYGSISGKLLCINRADYKVVILPPSDNILSETLKLLLKFAKAGGTIISLKDQPYLVDGENNPQIKQLLLNKAFITVETAKELVGALEKALVRQVSITDENGLELTDMHYIKKQNPDKSYALFIANTNREKGFAANIILSEHQSGSITILDALTGKSHSQNVVNGKFAADFGPGESKLYIWDEGVWSLPAAPSVLNIEWGFYTSLPLKTQVKRDSPNALTLDMCRFAIGSEPLSDSMEVWQAQREIRQRLDMRQVHHNGIPQRYSWINIPHKNDGAEISLQFTFSSLVDLCGAKLLIEAPDLFNFTLNGEEFAAKPDGFYLDKSLQTLPLPQIKAGENTLVLKCRYKNSFELENIYILGEFAVNSDRAICEEHTQILTGDWALQGYPYYAGALEYVYNLECGTEYSDIGIKLDSWSATVASIFVNGQEFIYPWKALGVVSVKEAIASGNNEIRVKLYSSPRNLLGPHHLAEGEPERTNDAAFRPEGLKAVADYRLFPYGLFNAPSVWVK